MDELSLFNRWLEYIRDPYILRILEDRLGRQAVERAQPALETLGELRVALQKHVTGLDGAVRGLGSMEAFLGVTGTPEGRANLEEVVGVEGATKARSAAKTMLEIDEELRAKVLDANFTSGLSRVTASFAMFDEAIAKVGDPESLATLEKALGADTTKRARSAARELLSISERLREMQPG